MKKLEIRTTTYEAREGFRVDIVEKPVGPEAWLYHEHYGIKDLMFGGVWEQVTMESFLDVVEANLEEYIEDYREEYMNSIVIINEAAKKLYEYMGHDFDSISNDMEHDYLTENPGRNGRSYLWYMDETECVAIDIETLEIHEDEEFFKEQFC